MQKLDMVLTNAQLVLEDKVISGGMAVHEGVIQDIFTGEAPQAEQTIDCEGKILFPGCIDTHVHFREPSPNEQEDFSTGTRSAAAGGVTCVVDHPIDVPPVLDAASYEKKLDAIAPKAYIDYGLWGGLTEKNLDSLPELWKKGVMAYKAFLCASDPLYPMVRDGALLEAMRRLSRMGAMLGVHAENNDIITYYREHRDPQDPWLSTTHSSMRPVVAELEAISRVILFAEATGAKLHILHMGIHEGADLVREAKKRGVHVTAETCPHYLVLHEGYFEKFGPYAKCCPPLRDKEHAQQLWKSLFDGTIDLVVSDHSPYTAQEKAKGEQDMLLAPPGLTGVQTTLPVMFSEAVVKRKMPLPQLGCLLSTNAAKLFGLYGRKGALKPGFDADFVLIDPEEEWTIRQEGLFYKNPRNIYDGFTVTGRPLATFVRGKCVYSMDKGFLQGPGYGKLYRRQQEI